MDSLQNDGKNHRHGLSNFKTFMFSLWLLFPYGIQAVTCEKSHTRDNYVATSSQSLFVSLALFCGQPFVKHWFLWIFHPTFLGPSFELSRWHQQAGVLPWSNSYQWAEHAWARTKFSIYMSQSYTVIKASNVLDKLEVRSGDENEYSFTPNLSWADSILTMDWWCWFWVSHGCTNLMAIDCAVCESQATLPGFLVGQDQGHMGCDYTHRGLL